MSEIYDKVVGMSRSDKIAYFKTLTTEQRKAYDNHMNYQRVLKNRNNDRAKYNLYMKGIKTKARKANPQLYRLQNNKDVANHRARLTLTPDAASKVISNNIRKYIAKLKALKEVNEDVVYKKLLANVKSSKMVDNMFDNMLSTMRITRSRGRPKKMI